MRWSKVFGWLRAKALMFMVCAMLIVSVVMLGIEHMGKFKYQFTMGNLVFGTGELPTLPTFTDGITLIAAAGTAILALAVGIVIYRRLKSVIR